MAPSALMVRSRQTPRTLLKALASSASERTGNRALTIGIPALLAVVAWLLRRISQLTPKRGKLPPGPESNWSPLNQAIEIYNRFSDLQYYYCELQAKYGKTFRVVCGPTIAPIEILTVITSPDNVKHLLKDNFDNYPKGSKIIEFGADFHGYGIFGVDGEEWYRQRKTASRIFTSDNIRYQMAKTLLDNWEELFNAFRDAGKGGTVPVDIEKLFLAFTLDTFVEVGFGVRPGTLDALSKADQDPKWERFAHYWDTLQHLCYTRTFNPFWTQQRWLARNLARNGIPVGFLCGPEVDIAEMSEFVDKTLDEIVELRQREGALKLADMGVSPKAPTPTVSPKTGSPGSRRSMSASQKDSSKRLDLVELFNDMTPPPTTVELRDMVKSMLVGGRDTTGATLTWTWYELGRNPKIEARLREEAKDLPTSSPVEFYTFVSKMTYCEACIRETIRLHTPVAIDAKTALQEDVMPDGTYIPAKSLVVYPPFVMARDTDLWGADALEYNPDRWIKDGKISEPSPYLASMFQAGPRMCLGKDLAVIEAKSVTALMVHKGVEMRWWPGTPSPKYTVAATLQTQPPGMLMSVTAPPMA